MLITTVRSQEELYFYFLRENCNKKAAKALRQLYRRPYFIPFMVDFTDSNWVLISSDFKGKVYKEVSNDIAVEVC